MKRTTPTKTNCPFPGRNARISMAALAEDAFKAGVGVDEAGGTNVAGEVTAVTKVVIAPVWKAGQTARLVASFVLPFSERPVCHSRLVMKSATGCGPQKTLPVSEVLLLVIWTCCPGHSTRQCSMFAGGQKRFGSGWHIARGGEIHTRTRASMRILREDEQVRFDG